MPTILFALALCAAQAVRAETLAAHCASIGDDDRTRPIPAETVPAALKLFKFPADAAGFVQASTVYRCMGGAVWLCNHGANLTCAKADVSRASKGAEAFCRQNPGAAVVPMVATGHNTIYSWKCVGGKPQIASAEKVDRRGFIANQWKRLDR
ncbi:hypothetical protein K9U39_08405 [Rhodoblastus acidophilus]|uniref:Uncharacterized protein n=1 Tax=Candidatus Rhodoblastus alkanivorans TaxID=2954117 RepID=A0ABS9Z7T6_9HYPH|nr:hypothetical protein [Candidatus Rhodoblastus alkanivorans]MCI4680809.1 hypothetical protein [Candidatus Rhodoblastus alkanivorans]MCI4683651.1 hypothetical protein [Candidatus Rhodoblastus alkanivorans]MDI4640967.1 hypothetical protein [Rhodoblastus acidophilus]